MVAVGGAGLILLATGCRIGSQTPDDGQTESAGQSPDIVAVGVAVGLLDQAVSRLRAITTTPRPVTESLRLHEVHLARLQGVSPASMRPTPSAPATPYPAHLTASARAGEQNLVHQFTGLAQRAESGDLARLFAAMAAATAQRLAAWPPLKGAR